MRTLLTAIELLSVCLVISSCSSVTLNSSQTQVSNNQILKHQKVFTHDYYYINVSGSDAPFVMQDIVGGEHENHYQILGFYGDKFLVTFESDNSDFSYGIDGAGFEFRKTPEGDLITIDYETTWVDIFTWSYPETSEYTLRVQKVLD